MTKDLIKIFLIWANQDSSGLRLTYSLAIFSIFIFLIYRIFYYLFFKEKCKVIKIFLYIIKIFLFFFCFKTDSVCESDEDNDFTWFEIFSWLFVGAGIFISASCTIDEIIYNHTFDITEVFNDEIADGFYTNSRGLRHYYWRGTNLTVSNNNWVNLTPWQQSYFRSINLHHCQVMHQKAEAAQRLQNFKVETNLLWDLNISEPVIQNANKNMLAYQNLEYLIEKNRIERQRQWIYNHVLTNCNKNRIMYNNIGHDYYQKEYSKKMCENCIENSFKTYKLHNSLKFKLK
jgi:hypothetical protein